MKLWISQADNNSGNADVISNAAVFFLLYERELAEKYLKIGRGLEPKKPNWPERLGQLYSLGPKRDNSQKDSSLKALAQYEIAYNLTEEELYKFYILSNLAKQSLGAGDLQAAKKYSKLLLSKASLHEDDWNYGNAIHHGNTVLGRCALIEGKIEKAKEYLILSGKTPGSPQLNSFGPGMTFAKELLLAGELEVVLEYLKLCSAFWDGQAHTLEKWIADIESGEIPKFGPNLRY